MAGTTNWMDMVPMLAAIAGQTGAALSEQGGNKMGVALGNLATQMGTNAAHAFPQGWSKATAPQTSALNTPFAPAGEYSVNQPGLTAQQAASSMANPNQQLQPMTSSGIRMSPFAAMMMSPEQQNAMAKSRLEQQAQPSRLAYEGALTEQAQAQTAATKHAMQYLSPWQQTQAKLEERSLELKEKATNAQIQGDEARSNLYKQEYARNQNIASIASRLNAETDPAKKGTLIEMMMNLSPETAIKWIEINAKTDPAAKMIFNLGEGLMKAAEGFGPGKADPVTAYKKAMEYGGLIFGGKETAGAGAKVPNPSDPDELNLGITSP